MLIACGATVSTANPHERVRIRRRLGTRPRPHRRICSSSHRTRRRLSAHIKRTRLRRPRRQKASLLRRWADCPCLIISYGCRLSLKASSWQLVPVSSSGASMGHSSPIAQPRALGEAARLQTGPWHACRAVPQAAQVLHRFGYADVHALWVLHRARTRRRRPRTTCSSRRRIQQRRSTSTRPTPLPTSQLHKPSFSRWSTVKGLRCRRTAISSC